LKTSKDTKNDRSFNYLGLLSLSVGPIVIGLYLVLIWLHGWIEIEQGLRFSQTRSV